MSKTKPAKAKPTNKAKRVVPRVSPLRGLSVEDYAARLSGWQADVVNAVIALVRAAAPTATAAIKWGQPVFDANGPFAWVKPAKAHVSVGFWRGAELDDPGKILEGDGDRMRHVKIASLEALPRAALTPMIRQAVRLNRELGTPTMR